MNLADLLRALARSSGTNAAISVNTDGEGHSTSVYSDDEHTVIIRDGETEVIRHRPTPGAQ
ncbi:MAG: hypothetical protein JWO68_2014 [Actinomycetia bacterium]|nr:hypothetical protein [Actinomycetes bacterium]